MNMKFIDTHSYNVLVGSELLECEELRLNYQCFNDLERNIHVLILVIKKSNICLTSISNEIEKSSNLKRYSRSYIADFCPTEANKL